MPNHKNQHIFRTGIITTCQGNVWESLLDPAQTSKFIYDVMHQSYLGQEDAYAHTMPDPHSSA